ncbi:MAG: YkgJ family cysteine cluster protein [Spirochaetales bacterium]|nr:YkgJ family cysteine cluster protein [Spirochaetales bacterium]
MKICNECVKTRTSCCNNREIFLTPGDIFRISNYTGSVDFFSFEKVGDISYLEQPDDPNWNKYTLRNDGTRRVLIRRENRDCLFLKTNGCELPMDIRPLLCRLHPVLYNEERITGFEKDCPAEILPPGVTLLDSLGMDLETCEKWRTQLYNEISP